MAARALPRITAVHIRDLVARRQAEPDRLSKPSYVGLKYGVSHALVDGFANRMLTEDGRAVADAVLSAYPNYPDDFEKDYGGVRAIKKIRAWGEST